MYVGFVGTLLHVKGYVMEGVVGSAWAILEQQVARGEVERQALISSLW